MPYTLLKTNGTQLTIVQDGTVDSSTSLILTGKNYSGYGQVVNENFVKLLENFANSTSPSKPLAGQLWYNTITKSLNLFDGGSYKTVSIMQTTSNPPSTNNIGELWFNQSNQTVYINNGKTYIPVSSAGSGGTLSVVSFTITDSVLAKHTVLGQSIDNTYAFITSNDQFLVPSSNSLFSKYPQILKGITLPGTNNNGVSVTSNPASAGNYLMWGTAGSALGLVLADGSYVTAAAFLTPSSLSNLYNPINVVDDTGITVGSNRVFRLWANGNIGKLSNIVSTRAEFDVMYQSTLTNVFAIDSSNGLQILPNANSPVSLGATGTGNQFSALYVNNATISGSASITTATITTAAIANLQASGAGSKIYGAWTLAAGATFQATYADLAERYASDNSYAPGTVLVIGGEHEVTLTQNHGNVAVAGIVSTNPAYTLNATAGDDATHPYIALKGRVPCKVTGLITKGDLLVTSSMPGYAERAEPGDSPNAILGRALQNFTGGAGVIEVMVV